MSIFYNTINIKGDELILAKSNAKSQEDFIRWLFIKEPTLEITPSQMLSLFGNDVPLTSVRRALTNLTNENLLEKTDKMSVGIYGKPEHIWKIKSQQIQNNFW